MRKVLINSSVLAAGMGLSQILLAVAYWWIAAKLSPSQFGIIMAAVGVAVLAYIAADFGANSLMVRGLAQGEIALSMVTTLVSVKAVVAAAVALLWVSISAALALRSSVFWAVLPLGFYVGLMILLYALFVPFRASERQTVVAAAAVLERAVTLLAVISLPSLGIGPAALAWSMVCGALCAVTYCAVLSAPGSLSLRVPKWPDYTSLWRNSATLGTVSLVWHLARLDVAIVSLFAGPATAGIFSIPARLGGPLATLVIAFSDSLYPRISGSIPQSQAHREITRGLVVLVVVMAIVLSGIAVAAPFLVTVFLPDAYAEVVPVLRIYLLGILFASMGQPLTMLLLAKADELHVVKIILPSLALGLGAIALGAVSFGAKGAAVGFVVLQLLILSLVAYRSRAILMGSGRLKADLPARSKIA